MPIQHVLIVDDALDFGRMLQSALAVMDAGHTQVSLVPSAEEALLEISRRAPDLVVSDVRLPGISGFDLVRKIRARSGQVKIVVVSGLKDPGLSEWAAQAGADLFFVKPLSVTEFIDAVRRLLQLEPASPLPAAQPAPGAGMDAPAPSSLITDLLAAARSGLGALAAVLLDPQGAVLARSGETPAPGLEARLLPAARAILAGAAGLSGCVDPVRREMTLAVKGREADWVLAPVGESLLVFALPAGGGAVRLPLAVETALTLRADLMAVLSVAPVSASTPAPVAPAPAVEIMPASPEVEAGSPIEVNVPSPSLEPSAPLEEADAETLAGLEDLLLNSAALTGMAGDFWEQAVSASDAPTIAGTLSYDQAIDLGFTPGQNQG